MDIKSRVTQLKIDIRTIFIAIKKKETPIIAKVLIGIVIGYALSPIDIIPDFIPFIGLFDDVIILPMLVIIIIKLIPPDIFKQCRIETDNLWPYGKPAKWYFALPIILFWLLLILLIIKVCVKNVLYT